MKVTVTKHAVTRYCERVKPQLGERQARLELEALLEFAEEVERPPWLRDTRESERWLLLMPHVVAAVQGGLVTTVMTTEMVEAPLRKRQRELERKERIRKRSRRRNLAGKPRIERPRSRIEGEAWPT